MPHNQPSGTRTNGPPSMALPIPPALQSPASLYAGPHPFAPESLLPMARRGSIAGVASLRRPSFASITPSPLSRTQSRDGSVTGSDSDLTAEENGPPGADPAVAGEADSRLVPPSLAIGMAASGQHAKAHTATMADRDTRGRRTSKPGLQPAPPPTTPSNHARPYPQRKSSLPSTPMSPLLGPDPVAPPMLADHLHRQSLHGPAHRLPPLSPTSLAGVATEPFLPPPAPPPLLPAAAAAAAAKGLPASTPGFSPPTQLQQRHQQLQEHQPLAWSSSSPVSPPPPPPQLGGLHRPVLLSHTHSLCLTPVESPTASRNSSYHSVSSAVGRIPVDPILAGVTLSPPSSPSRPRRQASQSAGDVANKSSRSGANKTSSDTIKSGHGLATRQEQQQQPTSKRGRFNWPWSRFVRQPAVHPAHLGASHSEAAIPQLIAPTEYDVNGNSRTPIVIGLTKNSPGSAISVNASMTSSLSDSDDTDESLSLGIQSRQPLGFPFQYPSTLSITSGGGIPQLGFGGGGGYSLGMHPPPRVRHGTSSSSVFKATGGDIQVVPLAPPTISEFRSRTSLFAPLSGGPSSSPTRRPTQISFGFRPPSIMSTGNGNTLGGGGGWGSARPSFTSHYTGTSFSDSMNPLSPKYTSRLTLASSSRPAGLRPTNSFQVGGRTRTASMYFAGARNASLTGSLGFGPSPSAYFQFSLLKSLPFFVFTLASGNELKFPNRL
ncbi:hypothetical protein BC828DRAFT_398398 [Blastocladiella britannica]|nr:hypothetical protein BC828DRAFT_398398 [Blastocladiella britannica]